MSKYIEFFAAAGDTAAAAVRNKGPAGRYAVVAADNMYFDADDAVIAWRNLLARRPGLSRFSRDDVHMVADFVNDGSAVFALPEEFVADLITASSLRLREVAAVWVPVMVADGTQIDVETAAVLLSRIAELARATADTEDRLYCWVAL